MQVNLNVAESLVAKLGEGFDVIGNVLIDREEERVPRRAPVTVGKAGEGSGVLLDPMLDTLHRDFGRDISPLRLEMIGDAEEHVNRLIVLYRATTSTRLKNIRQHAAIDSAH